jgi:hypothetical protein
MPEVTYRVGDRIYVEDVSDEDLEACSEVYDGILRCQREAALHPEKNGFGKLRKEGD